MKKERHKEPAPTDVRKGPVADEARATETEAPSELEARLKEEKDKYIRLYAEMENMRRRYERERAELVKYANEALIVEFLNILDDLERTVSAAQARHEDHQEFLRGVEMVMARVHDLLKKHGVRPIPAVGDRFDPHAHEILMQEENADHEPGTVLEEFQRGYRLGDRVVRTAKVKVAVPPRGGDGETSETDPREGAGD